MIVVVEGLDGVGKTTISKLLAETLDCPYIHESYTDDCNEKEQRVLIFKGRLNSKNLFIYDRTTLIDDFVYNFLNQKQSSLIDKKDQILGLLSKCKIFHLEIDENVRRQRFEQRGDDYITDRMIQTIKKQYEEFYSQLDNVEYVQLELDNKENVKQLVRRIQNDKNFTHSI